MSACAVGLHALCPQSRADVGVCDCPCHLVFITVDLILKGEHP